jgi:hypothetical protein
MNGGTRQSGESEATPNLRLVGGSSAPWQAEALAPGVSAKAAAPRGTRRVAGPKVARAQRAAPRQATSPPATRPEAPHGPVAARVAQTLEAADPRWVLAIRVAESLEGTILSPERRRSLIRMGKVFGLTAFDANLIIAIVQDQARRGYRPEVCPRMGEAQLRMVPLPRRAKLLSLGTTPARRWMTIALLIVGMAAAELAVLWLVFGA